MKVPLVDVGLQNASLVHELRSVFESALNVSAFIGGQPVAAFEESFASLIGGRHAVGTSSGTSALFLAYKALGVGTGDEVIVPANTYVATAEAVVLCGATPVFADVREGDFHIDPSSIESKLTRKTKLIVPVHLYGQSCDMKPLLKLAKDHSINIVNDTAQAHLSTYRNQSLSHYGEACCYSFYPGKNLGALGDAGAVVSDHKELMQKVKLISDHGCRKKYHHEMMGYNERLDALQAAFLSVKLKHLSGWTQKRQEKAAIYDSLIKDMPLVKIPQQHKDRSHVYHLYVIRVPERDKVVAQLNEVGIGAGIHYPFALTQTPSMKNYVTEPCPVAETLATEIMSLPLFPELNNTQQEYVVEQLKKCF